MSTSDDLTREFQYNVLFDKIDEDILKDWTRADDIRTCGNFTKKVMMRMEEKWDESLTIDHINRNCLDNRRSNLRLATREQQTANRKVFATNRSGHRGVRKELQYWRASANVGGKRASKTFPLTDAGLREACLHYRTVLRSDNLTCETCNPKDVVEEKIDMNNVVTRSFTFAIFFSAEDIDIFNAWRRPEEIRRLSRFCQHIAIDMFGEYDKTNLTVDHINRNCFNNRRSNLRLLSRSDQALNQRIPRNNQSGHKGVCKWTIARNGRVDVYWLAQFQAKGKSNKKSFPYTPIGLRQACAYYCKLRGGAYLCEACEATITVSSMGRIIEETEDYITFER